MEASKINKTMSAVALTCVAALLLFLFTRLELNKLWFEKIDNYWESYKEQSSSDAEPEQIKEERLGIGYKLSKQIEKNFEQKGGKKPVLLFEPNVYLEQTVGFKMPEPIVFYYYTGIKSVWMNSANVKDATHLVRFKDGRMSIDTIDSPDKLQQILNVYKSYTPAL